MSDDDIPSNFEEYPCVDKHRVNESDERTMHHVVFYDGLDIMYTQLLETIRHDGYEVVAFGPNYTIDDPEDDEIHELLQIDTHARDPVDSRIWAVFVETDDPYRSEKWAWEDDVPEWVDDLPR